MARRCGITGTLASARKHLIIKEIQAAVARELAAQSKVPETTPQRIADLLRELHQQLRDQLSTTTSVNGAEDAVAKGATAT
jgi:L-lysine 2,3-aminomutase